nr:hypothetical protein CFP56_11713 [Quercus suber]
MSELRISRPQRNLFSRMSAYLSILVEVPVAVRLPLRSKNRECHLRVNVMIRQMLWRLATAGLYNRSNVTTSAHTAKEQILRALGASLRSGVSESHQDLRHPF